MSMTPYDEQCIRKATRDGVLDALDIALRALERVLGDAAVNGDKEAMESQMEVTDFRSKLHDVRSRPGA